MFFLSSSIRRGRPRSFFFFFFNDTATTEIYTLSLHDALPIFFETDRTFCAEFAFQLQRNCPSKLAKKFRQRIRVIGGDRKSTRLNSSHSQISYAVFCLKKKKENQPRDRHICAHTTGRESTLPL